jgi:hypothetical protein
VPTNLRRLLNHLPLASGSRGPIYVKSTWHKATPFDQWTSRYPFRTPRASLRTNHFGRVQRRQRLVRWAIRLTLVAAAAWLVVESARGLAML